MPGTGDAGSAWHEQDQDGIDAEVLYPPVFITRFIENIADKEAYLAMVRAYNDFLAEDYCSVAPDRLIGNAVIPASGIDDALAELEAGAAARPAVRHLGSVPARLRAARPARTTRFWEPPLELGMPITAHGSLGTGPTRCSSQSAHGHVRPEDVDRCRAPAGRP